MPPITTEDLHAIDARTTSTAEDFVEPVNATCAGCDISNGNRQSAFLATCLEESAGFTHLDESLHYKDPKRVQALFKKHFLNLSLDDVRGYMGNPALFASRIYANRMGNGPESSGDGWNYRGRGIGMATGREMYAWLSTQLGVDLIGNPDLLLQPLYAVMSAGAIWKRKGLNQLADVRDIDAIRVKWNGGHIGQAEVEEFYSRALERLA